MEEKVIRYVAIYLRKSRGDDESALDKHRLVLTSLCEEKNWKYVVYEEIMSGENITMRPVFTQLLLDVENGVYDAVVCMEIDRLGRGNQADQGRINQAFVLSNTYIITPQQIFNLNNDSDEMIVDIKGFISRQEYKQIVKRLSQGKKIGSRQGYWTNGVPPYPYEYQKYKDKYNEKGLVVNDDKLKVYRYIINSVIKENLPPKQIAEYLNNTNVPSPRNGLWYPNTIRRLLIDQTHLGKIISNKTKGDGHAKKKPSSKDIEYISKDNWVVVNNCHEAVKTQEEHEMILLFLLRLTNTPRRTQQEILPLSGLIKCGKCGHTMGVYKRKNRKSEHSLKHCWYTDEYGNKCANSGIILEPIYQYIINDAKKYLKDLKIQSKKIDLDNKKISIENKIKSADIDIFNKNKALERILEAFENGIYSLEQFKERKQKTEDSINKIMGQKEILELELEHHKKENIENRIDKMELFFNDINNDNISDIDKNKLYKKIIDRIIWDRNGDDISINIKYL